jgi:hypothetical protein
MPVSVRSRFALLTIGRLVLGVAAVARAIELVRSETSSHLHILPTLLLAFGLSLLYWGVIGARALRGGHGVEVQRLISGAVADLDRRAPSGLKPLWIGILVVIVVFVAWMVIESMGTT